MRTYDEYRKILELWEQGIPKKSIGILLGIPRATVRDCIERYRDVEGLENNKARATKSTSTELLAAVSNALNTGLQQGYAYLLGLYLGDGYIVRNKRIFFLRIALDSQYPNIIKRCHDAMRTILPENKVHILNSRQGNWVEVIGFYKFWPDLFPQSGSGPKHKREIRLEDWQQKIVEAYPIEFFRGLYHSDGSRFSNVVNGKDYPRYQFTNSSSDIRQMFCETCDRLGLHWTAKARGGAITDIYVSRRKDVEYLDRLIGPKT